MQELPVKVVEQYVPRRRIQMGHLALGRWFFL